jgi:hypothetical protein
MVVVSVLVHPKVDAGLVHPKDMLLLAEYPTKPIKVL